jgi:hypothetical protein
MATARDLITDSLLWLGVNDAIDPVSPADADMGLRWLNKIVDLKNADALFASYVNRTVFDLVSGTAAYTVGSGGTVNVARPPNLTGLGETVTFIDTSQDPDTELPLDVLTDAQYQQIVQKSYESPYPQGVYYNATIASGFGTLTFWPVPNVSYLDGVLYSRAQLGAFTFDTELVLQPGVRAQLETKLALWLAPTFGKTPSPQLIEAAREAHAAVDASNTRISDLSVDPAYTPGGRGENFYTGGPQS